MLQTQVNYWTLQENIRHNIVTENLGYATLDETKRHNISVENYNTAFLNETSRHNVVQENLGYATLNENIRHNIQTEELGFQNLEETTRHNIVVENETGRHNKAEETIARQNISLGYANLNNEKNKLAEQIRANTTNEGIAQQNADTGYMNAATNLINAKVNKAKVQVETPSNVVKNAGSYFGSVFSAFKIFK